MMAGDFSKVLYSDSSMAVNAFFFACAMKLKHHDDDLSEKSTVWFSPYDAANQATIQSLVQYEQVILDEYRKQLGLGRKTPLSLLKNQLLSGNLRLYKMTDRKRPHQIVVKLSGVWESSETYGVTFKFLECSLM